MQGLSTDDKQAALGAFLDPEPPPLELVDRSSLDRWAICPAQADLCENGKQGPLPAIVDTGELVHLAFSAGVRDWIESNCEVGPKGIVEAVESALRGSRPDLQPDAIQAAKASIWQFADFLKEINPTNIYAFDGGEDLDKSGQLAMDIPGAGVRYTSEIDFLHQGHAPDVLCEDDWKSGWKLHWPEDVYKSFQFTSHAVLVFENFPDAKALDVTIWDVRRGRRTYPVRFERKFFGQYMGRIHAALQSRHDHRDNPVPWPVAEKCGACPVAIHCPASGDIGAVAADPQQALREYIAACAKVNARGKLLTAHVKHHGAIELPTGERFAAEHKSKPRAQLIASKGGSKPEDTEE